MDSILTSIKKPLGLTEEYEAFDQDIIMHINTVFISLNQLGIGPEEGFSIEDSSATWYDFIGDNLKLNAVKTYIYLKVRLLFDPPANSVTVEAIKQQITELEWRLNLNAE